MRLILAARGAWRQRPFVAGTSHPAAALWQDWTASADRHLVWVVRTATGDEWSVTLGKPYKLTWNCARQCASEAEMNKTVRNERRKLTASWFNAIATALMAAGVFAPAASQIYGFGSNSRPIRTSGASSVPPFALRVSLGLHLDWKAASRRTRGMTQFQALAILMPVFGFDRHGCRCPLGAVSRSGSRGHIRFSQSPHIASADHVTRSRAPHRLENVPATRARCLRYGARAEQDRRAERPRQATA